MRMSFNSPSTSIIYKGTFNSTSSVSRLGVGECRDYVVCRSVPLPSCYVVYNYVYVYGFGGVLLCITCVYGST